MKKGDHSKELNQNYQQQDLMMAASRESRLTKAPYQNTARAVRGRRPPIPCIVKGGDGREGPGPGTAVGHCTFNTVQTLDRMECVHVAGPWK